VASKQRRDLGDLDAKTDQRFKNHFVESIDLSRINNNNSSIVYGSKGAGKTALRRALTELNRDSFLTTKTIDLDEISFAQVHQALARLRDTSRAEIANLARNTWRNVLAVYCLEAVADTVPKESVLRREIREFLASEGYIEIESSNNRIIGLIERLLTLSGGIGLERGTSHSLGLTKTQLSVINEFPYHPALRSLLDKCAGIIEESGKFVLICLDGFDSIIDHTPESRKAIFAGLIDAIYKCSKDRLFCNSFCFKAFLPRELTEEARMIVWDADKFIQNTHYLRWPENSFQDLLSRRLQSYSRTKSGHFNDIWRDLMPEKIKNPTHGVEEYSFGYILRHTLYRPRQVLTHMQRIFDYWDESPSSSFRVDPSFIPPIIARTNYEMAQYVVNQMQITHPQLGHFMKSWGGSSNTIFVGDFQDRIGKIFGCQTLQETGTVFDSLFNLGIFGLARSSEIKNSARSTSFRFGFVGDTFAPNIHATVNNFDVVALSPMFSEFCGCTASDWGAVIPTE